MTRRLGPVDEIHSGLPRPVPAGGRDGAAVSAPVPPCSRRAFLGRSAGHFVTAFFRGGSRGPVTRRGFLHSTGSDYLAIYQPERGRMTVCALDALEFLEFRRRR